MSKELLDAIRLGDLASVGSLLDANPALANARNDQGIPAIAFAVYNRKPEIAALLETRGADIDVFSAAMLGRADAVGSMVAGNKGLLKLISADGWTALHLAAFFGNADCTATLLNAGADVSARSTNPMQNMPLHAGVAGGSADVIKLLLNAGAPANARQHGGWTPLHAAAQSGNVPIAEMLLAAGADASARADNNQGALDLALTRGHQAMVDLLEKHGVKF